MIVVQLVLRMRSEQCSQLEVEEDYDASKSIGSFMSFALKIVQIAHSYQTTLFFFLINKVHFEFVHSTTNSLVSLTHCSRIILQ